MDPSRRQADEDVAGFDVFTGNDLVAVDDADAETSQVIVVFGIETGHFSRFDAVLADRIVLAHQDGQAQLGADTVGAADQDRFLDVTVHQGKETAETAQVAEDFRTVRGFDRIFHQFYGFVASIDVDTGISISQSFICSRAYFSPSSLACGVSVG